MRSTPRVPHVLSVVGLGVVLLAPPMRAQTPDRYVEFVEELARADPIAELPAEVQADEFVERLWVASGVPGLAVAVARGDRLLFSDAAGYADLEHLVPATPTTVFDVGSVSKVMSAVAIMQLVERGLVSLGDPVREYVPELPERAGTPITLWHVLTHTSGIRHYEPFDFPRGSEWDNVGSFESFEEAITLFVDDPLLFEPGTYYRYTSYAFNLLQGVVERVTGLPFEEYMRTRVWGPAGMLVTRFDRPRDIVFGRARGYEIVDGRQRRYYPDENVTYKFASGGMMSSAEDLARFGVALLGGRLMGPETLEAMFEPQAELDDLLYFRGDDAPTPLRWRQAIAWRIRRDHEGNDYVHHCGSVKGFKRVLDPLRGGRAGGRHRGQRGHAGPRSRSLSGRDLSSGRRRPVTPHEARRFTPAAAMTTAEGVASGVPLSNVVRRILDLTTCPYTVYNPRPVNTSRLLRTTPIALVLAFVAPVQAQEPGWSTDLEYMAEQLEVRHPNLYHTLSPDRFRLGVEDLAARAPGLSDEAVTVGLARLLARIGDGHTLVNLLSTSTIGRSRLPLEFVRTRDGLSILAADTSLGSLPGSRVLFVGSLPAAAALDSMSTLISRDNEWTPYHRAAEYLEAPGVLHALGITPFADAVRLVLEGPSGARREIMVRARDRGEAIRWQYGAFGDSRPWLARRDDPYWFTTLPGDSIAYVQFNRADRDKEDESLAEFGRRLLREVTGGSVRRIVLDLRWNSGGSRWRARLLLGALIAAEHALGSPRSRRSREPTGHLVTLISPRTFSAATQFALDLELHTNTAFVGSPTGGKPNHFGEVGRFDLPASGVEVRHSVYYLQATHPRDTRPAIFPDRRVEWTWRDVATGRDPVLEAAIGWQPLASGADELEQRIRKEGIEVALAWWRSLRDDPAPAVRITEAEANRLGYGLLDEDPSAAAAVFRENLERHPWSANAHDSLADALLALGREAEAAENLCRAFEIDPQFDRALERDFECRTAPEP